MLNKSDVKALDQLVAAAGEYAQKAGHALQLDAAIRASVLQLNELCRAVLPAWQLHVWMLEKEVPDVSQQYLCTRCRRRMVHVFGLLRPTVWEPEAPPREGCEGLRVVRSP